MRRYATSKGRLALFILLIGGVIFLTTSGYAQSTGNGTTPPPPAAKQSIFSLILSNVDAVFITISILSICGVTLIIQGFIKNRKSVFMPPETTNTIREMIAQKRFKELIDFTETDPSFVSKALNPALKRAPSFSSMKEAMETSIGEQTAEEFRKIEYLNIIGNLGPLLGLLGTVLGMIYAFQAMGVNGEGKPADLAVGISKALCHTMLGLILAVPCLAAFGVLRTMVDRLTVSGALEAEELLLMIKPVEAKPAAATARPGAVPQPGVPAAAPARKPAPPLPPGAAPQG